MRTLLAVFGCWAGSATGCVMFLYCVDTVFDRSQQHDEAQVELARRNMRLGDEVSRLKTDKLVMEAQVVRAKQEAKNERQRAEIAEQQVLTFKALADAARRDKGPMLGDDPADRIPPQNVPLP